MQQPTTQPTTTTEQAPPGRSRIGYRVMAALNRDPRTAPHAVRNDTVLAGCTAKTHVSRIMGKLDARDRARLVIVAYES